MRDNYGDKISVHAGGAAVYLAVTSHFNDELTDAAMTPAKARKLARKLRKVADEIDGGGRAASSISAVTSETSSATADGDDYDFDEYVDAALAVARETSSASADAPLAADEPASGYLLPLTQDEAETLAVILAKVGGPTGWDGGPSSPRIHAASVSEKLLDLGVEDGVDLLSTGRFPVVEGLGGVFGGSIYFEATS